jgi:hypothetical protein
VPPGVDGHVGSEPQRDAEDHRLPHRGYQDDGEAPQSGGQADENGRGEDPDGPIEAELHPFSIPRPRPIEYVPEGGRRYGAVERRQ